MLFRVLAILLPFFLVNIAEAASVAPQPDWAYVQTRLKKAKLPQSFIDEMRRIYNKQDFMKILELNTLLFLRSGDYHGPQATVDAVGEVRAFVAKNRKAFDWTEKTYGVSPEVISSLLYIETRHGKNRGKYHVASIFLHLIQADRPAVVRYLKSRLPAYTSNYDRSMQTKIGKRAKLKSDWALAEIKALSQIYKKDKKILKGLKGSFSGAFGMAQFIPSSYNSLAKPYRKGRSADLTKSEDAIRSVANYLYAHGWRKSTLKTHKRALMRYNNSEDYADAILSLAKRSRPPAARLARVTKPKKTARNQKTRLNRRPVSTTRLVPVKTAPAKPTRDAHMPSSTSEKSGYTIELRDSK